MADNSDVAYYGKAAEAAKKAAESTQRTTQGRTPSPSSRPPEPKATDWWNPFDTPQQPTPVTRKRKLDPEPDNPQPPKKARVEENPFLWGFFDQQKMPANKLQERSLPPQKEPPKAELPLFNLNILDIVNVDIRLPFSMPEAEAQKPVPNIPKKLLELFDPKAKELRLGEEAKKAKQLSNNANMIAQVFASQKQLTKDQPPAQPAPSKPAKTPQLDSRELNSRAFEAKVRGKINAGSFIFDTTRQRHKGYVVKILNQYNDLFKELGIDRKEILQTGLNDLKMSINRGEQRFVTRPNKKLFFNPEDITTESADNLERFINRIGDNEPGENLTVMLFYASYLKSANKKIISEIKNEAKGSERYKSLKILKAYFDLDLAKIINASGNGAINPISFVGRKAQLQGLNSGDRDYYSEDHRQETINFTDSMADSIYDLIPKDSIEILQQGSSIEYGRNSFRESIKPPHCFGQNATSKYSGIGHPYILKIRDRIEAGKTSRTNYNLKDYPQRSFPDYSNAFATTSTKLKAEGGVNPGMKFAKNLATKAAKGASKGASNFFEVVRRYASESTYIGPREGGYESIEEIIVKRPSPSVSNGSQLYQWMNWSPNQR